MNSCFVREGVAANDCFVWLHVEADDAREQLARRIKLAGFDVCYKRQSIGAHVHRHHDLFERCVSGTLADAVDRAFNLSRACFNRRQSICHCETEIVVTVNTDRHVPVSDNTLAHLLDQMRKLDRRCVANRVRHIEHGSACIDRNVEHFTQVIDIAARRIFR